jgi:hypothetical protein
MRKIKAHLLMLHLHDVKEGIEYKGTNKGQETRTNPNNPYARYATISTFSRHVIHSVVFWMPGNYERG